jgi:hypothetical protein
MRPIAESREKERRFRWHAARSLRLMAKRRAEQAPLGLTSNGILIVNALGLLDAREVSALRKALPGKLGSDWFVGVAVGARDVSQLVSRLDDAAAEGAALLAGRQKRTTRTNPRRK